MIYVSELFDIMQTSTSYTHTLFRHANFPPTRAKTSVCVGGSELTSDIKYYCLHNALSSSSFRQTLKNITSVHFKHDKQQPEQPMNNNDK